jgi:hypothetical protein
MVSFKLIYFMKSIWYEKNLRLKKNQQLSQQQLQQLHRARRVDLSLN